MHLVGWFSWKHSSYSSIQINRLVCLMEATLFSQSQTQCTYNNVYQSPSDHEPLSKCWAPFLCCQLLSSHHPTFFTCQRSTLPSPYLYQKDERELSGNLRRSKYLLSPWNVNKFHASYRNPRSQLLLFLRLQCNRFSTKWTKRIRVRYGHKVWDSDVQVFRAGRKITQRNKISETKIKIFYGNSSIIVTLWYCRMERQAGGAASLPAKWMIWYIIRKCISFLSVTH